MLAKTTSLVTFLILLAATNAQSYDTIYARDAKVPGFLKSAWNDVKTAGKDYGAGFAQGVSRRDLELIRRVAEAEAEAEAGVGQKINKVVGDIAKAEGTMGGAFVKAFARRDLDTRHIKGSQVATGIEKAIGTGLGTVMKALKRRAAEAGLEAEEYIDVLYGRDAEPEYDDLLAVYARDAEADFDDFDLYTREAKVPINHNERPFSQFVNKTPVMNRTPINNEIIAREAKIPLKWGKIAPGLQAGAGALAQSLQQPQQPQQQQKRDAEADPEIFDFEE